MSRASTDPTARRRLGVFSENATPSYFEILIGGGRAYSADLGDIMYNDTASERVPYEDGPLA